jgi:hypothetical protein
MEESTVHLIVQIFIAIGTVAVSILAIWGDKIRACIAGPKLEFVLYNAHGDLTTRQDGKRTIYYHIKIKNKRQWAPARRVRILCTAISKKAPDGSFVQEPLTVPVQLTWAFPTFHELLPNIATDDVCDLGYLNEASEQFMLSLYIYPNNFRGFISANTTMRIGLIASADNFTSKTPYVLEISWDGEWSSNLDEMRKHLVVKEV